jgi:hypothetical protein
MLRLTIVSWSVYGPPKSPPPACDAVLPVTALSSSIAGPLGRDRATFSGEGDRAHSLLTVT